MMRRWSRSLTGRLLVLLVLVQATVPIMGMAAWMIFSPYVTWTDVATASAQGHLQESLVRDPAGYSIRPTAALREYAAARPTFGYAALDRDRIVTGSDARLATLLSTLGPRLPAEGQLAIPEPGGGIVRFARGRDGVVLATIGDAFHADDLGGFARYFLPALIPIFGPSLLVALLAVPWVIHRTMRPLRKAADAAADIEFTALDRRLSETGVPNEALPLVRAVNAALDRLSGGAQRQRLFHANAAHELRTPIAILQARLDAMPDLPRRHDIRSDVRRIARLVEQLLSVERLGAGGVAMEPLDLVQRVRAVVADCAPLAIRAGRVIDLVAIDAAVPMLGNARALEGAVANLIDNALRAEPDGGTVEVRVGPGRTVEVIDHGAGVAPDDLGLVFEPFWRKDERPAGTGLGLSIVREVARLHGGEVHVAQGEGGGARFVMSLG